MSDITDRLTPAIADRYRIEGELVRADQGHRLVGAVG
jgi:hypothetical protein